MAAVTILAVGRLKRGPETELVSRYQTRLKRLKTSLREFPERQSKSREGVDLLAALPGNSFVIALDEHGDDMASAEFASLLGDRLDQGQVLSFIIGGSDGLADEVRQRADRVIRFGRLTWPHQLVRGLLMEQIYRAETILLGHPYHRV
ncbi:MAG: 23S rRNA (pseudouridine(1915)-N(3))-methyltransferase RlmH [Kiloniella sp.]|nr:23S rRNA (pseudouridine(1915)-N(3))-methyltransferase RlmH [Kiloniella sp.]RZO31792.1 MAG: 23S rRNA (pseudouridine(1915)-N(3))-methyltransferase RlmH [Rhodospirillaceae bacterium]